MYFSNFTKFCLQPKIRFSLVFLLHNVLKVKPFLFPLNTFTVSFRIISAQCVLTFQSQNFFCDKSCLFQIDTYCIDHIFSVELKDVEYLEEDGPHEDFYKYYRYIWLGILATLVAQEFPMALWIGVNWAMDVTVKGFTREEIPTKDDEKETHFRK